MSTGWEEFEEHEEIIQETEGTQQSGHQYYSVIIGHPVINPTLFLPYGPEWDKDRKPIPNRYATDGGNKISVFLGSGKGGNNCIDGRLVQEWRSKKDSRDRLTVQSRKCIDGIKALLKKANCAVWFHNANTDHCSQFGGPHLHIVYESTQRASGSYIRIHDQSYYRSLKQQLKNDGGYAKCQGVRYLDRLVLHLNTKPRVYLGTKSRTLGAVRRDIKEQSIEGVSFDDMCFVEDGDISDTEEQGTSAAVDEFGSDSDARVQPTDEFDEEPAPKRARTDNGGQQLMTSFATVTKETPADRRLRVLEHVFRKTGYIQFNQINEYIGTKMKKDSVLSIVWSKLAGRTSTQVDLKNLGRKLQVEDQALTLRDLSARYISSRGTDENDEYLNLYQSFNHMLAWLLYNNIDFYEFSLYMRMVIDREKLKRNAVLFLGPSNGGKTIFIFRSLMPLTPYVGVINTTTSDNFTFQGIIGKRIAFFEECQIDPVHIQVAKQIFEGSRDAMVHVKYGDDQSTGRVPIICLSNSIPWGLCVHADKEAMKNRTKIFNIKSDPELISMKKAINPGIWYLLCCLLDQDLDITFENAKEISLPAYEIDDDMLLLD